jgi:hypothetical protein
MSLLCMQDAARSVVLSLLLQKALQLSSEEVVQHEKASAQRLLKRLDSWPIVLANSVCHQVSMLLVLLVFGLLAFASCLLFVALSLC